MNYDQWGKTNHFHRYNLVRDILLQEPNETNTTRLRFSLSNPAEGSYYDGNIGGMGWWSRFKAWNQNE